MARGREGRLTDPYTICGLHSLRPLCCLSFPPQTNEDDRSVAGRSWSHQDPRQWPLSMSGVLFGKSRPGERSVFADLEPKPKE